MKDGRREGQRTNDSSKIPQQDVAEDSGLLSAL